MKATDLLEKIRENLKDYPIDYLKRKATDDRYPDSITKRLAIYNSSIFQFMMRYMKRILKRTMK